MAPKKSLKKVVRKRRERKVEIAAPRTSALPSTIPS